MRKNAAPEPATQGASARPLRKERPVAAAARVVAIHGLVVGKALPEGVTAIRGTGTTDDPFVVPLKFNQRDRDRVVSAAPLLAAHFGAGQTDEGDIIRRVAKWAGGRDEAYSWYRAEPIPAFGDRTPESIVKSGHAGALLDYLDSIAIGGFA